MDFRILAVLSLLFVHIEGGNALRTIGVGSSAPEFVHPAHNVTVQEGQEVTLMCSVSSLKGYKLAWVHEESQSILSIGRNLYTRTPRLSIHADHHSVGLTISPVSSIDRGWYMCQLNTDPMTYTRSYLQVLVPPTLEDWSGSYVEVREGASVRLTCSARAFPPAVTTWRRSDAEPIFRTPAIVWVVESSDLVFESVRRVHGGAYTCHVDNKVTAPVSRTTHLTVTYAPVLWLGRELVGVKAGTDITLNCSSEANPPPSHYWSANGTNVTNSDKYQVDEMRLSTRTEVLLTIRNVGPQDFTRYRCHASNPIGQAEGTIRLYELKERIMTVPTRPTWKVPPPGQYPAPKHLTSTTEPPNNSSNNARPDSTWRKNNRVSGSSSRTGHQNSKKITVSHPGTEDLQKRRRPKNYRHHGGNFNDTLFVDLILDVERSGSTAFRASEIIPASDAIVLFHVLYLVGKDWVV